MKRDFWGEEVKCKALREKKYSARKLKVLEVGFAVENDFWRVP